mmetsp:Transcript_18398/g.33091  ORF Transcript_18398/g.33091 Transcript_18398/m.33091 type:complete len:952 (-) Transcript_18398:22-2877(-)
MEADPTTTWYAQPNPKSDASEWYVLSMKWLRFWKISVGLEEGEAEEVGSVDNSELLDDVDRYKIPEHIGCVVTKQGLTCGLEYDLVPSDVWGAFKAKYGVAQGSEITRRRVQISPTELQVEVTLRPLLIVFLYKSEVWQLTTPKPMYVSRFTKISSIAGLVVELINSELQLKVPSYPAKLRKLAADTDIQDFEATCVKSKAPCMAPLLDYKKSLVEAQMADNDILLVEVPDEFGHYKLTNSTQLLQRLKCLCGQLILPGEAVKCECGQVNFCSMNCVRSLKKIHSCGPVPSGGKQKSKSKASTVVTVATSNRKPKHEEQVDDKQFAKTSGSKLGLMGLQNLGNTCFMNSALQCLSHIKPLTDYFIAGQYKDDLNVSNPLGSKNAKVAKAYAHLVKTLWLDTLSSFAPWNFKGAIGDFAPVFHGFQQHDSQEMLSYTLDALHEDLNRVKVKPYTSEISREGLTEDELANGYWAQFQSRNSSIVSDLMYGQYRSEVTCPECSNVSLAFDPFLMLSVSVPAITTKSIDVSLIRMDGQPTVKFSFVTNKKPTISQVVKIVKEKADLRGELLAASYTDKKLEAFLKDESTTAVLGEKESLSLLEYSPEAQNLVRVVLDFTKEEPQETRSRVMVSKSRVILLSPLNSLKEVHLAVYQFLTQSPSERFAEHFPELHGSRSDSIYTLRVVVPKQTYVKEEIFTTKRKKHKKHTPSQPKKSAPKACTICERLSCTNCPLEFSDSTTLADLLAKRALPTDLRLEVAVRDQRLQDKLNEKVEHESVANAKRIAEESKREYLTLDDCLRYSTDPEKLRQENSVYCGKCQAHVQGIKKMSIFRLPQVLILHLKRFKHSGGFLKKLDTLIRFPVNDLDMTDYLVGPKAPAVYDLFAVSNHSGGIGGGHYTAYCKNPESNCWHYFNDSSVSAGKPDGSGVMSSSAYVLLYKLKEAEVQDTESIKLN